MNSQTTITESPGFQTLADRIKGKEPDYPQLLRDLTAKQTALLNAGAPEPERIEVFKEIQGIQKIREDADRR